MIDLEKAEEFFDEYVSHYEDTNGKIVLKKQHTKRVQKVAKEIAEYLKLDEEDCKLAELIGLLHDIGRFEQIKRYNTFSDRNSVNHAELGLEILFKDGYINKFLKDEKYHSIIYKAILNHNKIEIEDNLTKRELLHSKIIRDADKIDILQLEVTEPFEVLFGKEDVSDQTISDEVYQDFIDGKLINRAKQKTDLDSWIITIAFVFDLNFPISVQKVKNNKSVYDMIDRIPYKNEETIARIKMIKEKVNEFFYTLGKLSKIT